LAFNNLLAHKHFVYSVSYCRIVEELHALYTTLLQQGGRIKCEIKMWKLLSVYMSSSSQFHISQL